MFYINKKSNPSGGYASPKNQPFPGCIALDDEQAKIFFDYNGFIILKEENDSFYIEPNIKAWQNWKEQVEENDVKIEAKNQILKLKEELSSTDYKIIKCYEFQLAKMELPYNIVNLHEERQMLRDKINELEELL